MNTKKCWEFFDFSKKSFFRSRRTFFEEPNWISGGTLTDFDKHMLFSGTLIVDQALRNQIFFECIWSSTIHIYLIRFWKCLVCVVRKCLCIMMKTRNYILETSHKFLSISNKLKEDHLKEKDVSITNMDGLRQPYELHKK